jgi:hypothetical protein
VDVSLKGTSVEPDVDDMEAAYGEGTTPADVLQVRNSASFYVLRSEQCNAPCAAHHLDSVHGTYGSSSSSRQAVASTNQKCSVSGLAGPGAPHSLPNAPCPCIYVKYNFS